MEGENHAANDCADVALEPAPQPRKNMMADVNVAFSCCASSRPRDCWSSSSQAESELAGEKVCTWMAEGTSRGPRDVAGEREGERESLAA